MSADRPVFTCDLDGVLCSPPLGLNLGIGRRLERQPPDDVGPPLELRGIGRLVWLAIEWLRYAGRACMPDAREGLAAIAGYRQVILVSGRKELARPWVERWLERYGLRQYISGIRLNNTRLSTARFKLLAARQVEAWEHCDDDGPTAIYLAQNGLRRVYLRRWFMNRGLPYPPNVVVVRSLLEVAEDLARLATSPES
ncbi:MAG: hypothetical protein C4315_00230 [Chloroflexota bacterium]